MPALTKDGNFSTETLQEDTAVLYYKDKEIKYYDPRRVTEEIIDNWCKIYKEGLNGTK